MRCPKCGYISFDHQPSCKKCSADLTGISAALSGTGLKGGTAFFLASVLAGEGAAEGDELDLSTMTMALDEEVAFPESETSEGEGVPVVDLAPFAMPKEEADEEEISLTLPEEVEEEAVTEQGVAAGAEDELSGSIDFSMGEEELQAPNVNDLLLDREAPSAAAPRLVESKTPVEADEGGIPFSMEEAPAQLELEEAEEAEEESGGIDFDLGLMPEIEMEESAAQESASPPPPAAKSDSGLNLDLDLDLEEEAVSDDQVFNLEDIDMADLVIDDNGTGRKGRPEDTALDLEDFLNEGKTSEAEDGQAGKMPDVEL